MNVPRPWLHRRLISRYVRNWKTMLKVIFIEHSGARHEVDATPGDSVMQAAVNKSVPGILADCGGNCSCATCHVYIGAPWSGRIPEPAADERAMIECAMDVRETSRLGCQVKLTPELEGLIVHLPISQT
jgi:2Fe-2S ferredoxin